MSTSENNSDILRPHKTLEKNGVPAIQWTSGSFEGVIFTIASVQFEGDEDNPKIITDYHIHEDGAQFEEADREQFEEELSEFVIALIVYGKLRGEKPEDENRTNDPKQSST